MFWLVWLENPKGRGHSEGLDIDGGIILKWMLMKWMGGCGLDSSCLG
jgi:hypothetical protein